MLTCFGVSLDGEAAFPNVEREIQIRELYSAGERESGWLFPVSPRAILAGNFMATGNKTRFTTINQ